MAAAVILIALVAIQHEPGADGSSVDTTVEPSVGFEASLSRAHSDEPATSQNNSAVTDLGPHDAHGPNSSAQKLYEERVGPNEVPAGRRYFTDLDEPLPGSAAATRSGQPPAAAGPAENNRTHPVTRGPLTATSGPSDTDASRPWWPLVVAVLTLFASLGFNLYLGWIAWDLHTRYQDVVAELTELETRYDQLRLRKED